MRSAACVCLVIGLGLGLVGCPPPTVIRDGREVTVEKAERDDLATARELAAAGRTAEAIRKYHEFLKEFPAAEQVDRALAEVGQLLAGGGRHQEAVQVFQRLVAEHPDSPHYLMAAVQLGLSLAELGRTEEALPTLQSVFDQLPDQKRQAEVAAMLAAAYERGGAPVEAIRWYARLHRLSPDPEVRQPLRHRLVQLIDSRLSFVQVREALEVLKDTGENAFPLDLLQLKLAKIYFHIYDFERARALLESFVAAWPDHPRSGQAGTLLKRILDRGRVNRTAVGVLLPLTGKYRAYGQKALAGIQLGAGILDSGGSEAPGPVLIIRDSGGDPEQAARHVEELVYDEHAVAIIGPVFSAEAYAAAVRAEQLQVPIITLSLRADITAVGPRVFRSFLTLAAQARLLVEHAMEKLGVRRFALLYPNDKYGVGFVNAFWDEVRKRKGEIRAAERYEPDEKNFAAHIKKMVGRYWLDARRDFVNQRNEIRKKYKDEPLARKHALEKLVKSIPPKVDFGAIFVPDYHEKVAMIAPALAFEDIVLHTDSHWKRERIKKSLGRDKLDMVYLLGGNGWNNPQLIEWSERYVQGTIFCDGFFGQSQRPATRRFVAAFKAAFDREPNWVEAYAHDTAALVRRIIEKAKPAERPAFRKALLELQAFTGATGLTGFAPDGEVEQDLFLLTIDDEEIEEIEAEPETADAGT